MSGSTTLPRRRLTSKNNRICRDKIVLGTTGGHGIPCTIQSPLAVRGRPPLCVGSPRLAVPSLRLVYLQDAERADSGSGPAQCWSGRGPLENLLPENLLPLPSHSLVAACAGGTIVRPCPGLGNGEMPDKHLTSVVLNSSGYQSISLTSLTSIYDSSLAPSQAKCA